MTGDSGFITLSGVVKAYGENTILKGIDLAIGRGEFLVLVGPSGCGKSTLLRCIAGLEEITAGTLHIDGRLCNNVHPKDRDLAMVFQSYALYPHLTVAQNLGFSLTVRKLPDAEITARVAEVAERLGLTPLLDRYPKQMSGGQRQRVAVGRAIVRNPNAFLFDEPLSNLDAALRSQMRIELKKLHRDLAATMIYVTHDQVEAMTLADRIVVLNDGIIQQIGTPDQLYRTPANRFVAHFIGSPPMNFFPATVQNGRAVGDGVDVPLPPLEGAPANIIVGVRPSALKLSGAAGTVRGVVEVVEPVGGESYVHLSVGGRHTVAQIDSREAFGLPPGQELTFGLADGELHVFDAATEKALWPVG